MKSLFIFFLLFISFIQSVVAQAPSGVTTTAPSQFTATSCMTGGNVTTGFNITAKGVVYAKTAAPTLSNSFTVDGTGTGSFTSFLSGLDSGSVYSVRAYARNIAGTTYGNQHSFHTNVPVSVIYRGATARTMRSVYVIHDATTNANLNPQNTERGILYARHNPPTFSDSVRTLSVADLGNGRGNRTQALLNLLPGTTYYVRSYAINPIGSRLSTVDSFTTTTAPPSSGGCPSPTDIDGNVYPVIKIGNSCWLQTNLKTTRYRNGDSVRQITSNTEWASTMASVPHQGAWCYYQNDTAYNLLRGKLYNWMAVVDTRGLCPTGWSSPSNAEFNALIAAATSNTSLEPGISLKSESYGYISNNSSGFSAVPGFRRRDDGVFEGANDPAHFWTTDLSGTTQARARELAIHRNDLQDGNKNRRHGYSVRCVRNETLSISTLPGTVVGSTGFSTGGTVSSSAGDSVLSRGVAYATHSNPTTSDLTVAAGSGVGSFSANVTGLTSGTTYYFRSYAVIDAGTSYGNIDSISLIPSQVLASLTTTDVSNITDSSALSGGEITSDGGAAVTQRGIAYSTSPNPDISSSTTTNGTGTGIFSSALSGLTPGTAYYVRAYAINSVGTAYGAQVNFTTRVSVGGALTYANASSTAFTNSSVSLLKQGNAPASAATLNSSQFAFSPLDTGSYNLSVSTSKPWRGVNATDAILIINHYSNGLPLTGIRQTAADVDANSSVNATDALQTLQRSVGIRSSFDAGNFVWNPTALNIPLGSGTITLPVSVLATGDVNASYVPSLQLRQQWGDFLPAGVLSGLSQLGGGLLPLAVNRSVLPAAVSLSLELPEGARLEGVEVPGHQGNFPVIFHQEGQQARIAWCNPNAVPLPADAVLCGLKISGGDPALIRWGSESEVADAQGVAYDGLIWRKPDLITSAAQFDTRLFPNPASGTSILDWTLSQAAELDIEVFDAQGCRVWKHSEAVLSGSQSMSLPSDWSAGVYSVQIKAVLADGNVFARTNKLFITQ